jgi:dTDP-4-dehydrorhamnose 3,5-epimerase
MGGGSVKEPEGMTSEMDSAMKAEPSSGSRIPGVRISRVQRHGDERGAFREVWRSSWYGALDPRDAGPGSAFVQANVSTSAAGVLRGLHFHRRQLDHWVILEGTAVVALVDVRPMLAQAGRPVVETHVLGADESVAIPAGVAHGFLATDRLTLLYLVTNEYDGSDELGFAWDDPDAAVPWPTVASTPDGLPVLSGRDRSNPSLRELVARLRD